MYADGLGGRTAGFEESLLSSIDVRGAGRETSDRVYGSQEVAVGAGGEAAVIVLALVIVLELPFVCIGGRCPFHTCAAAREAAVGGLFLMLAAILPPFDAGRSFVTVLSVFNIPGFFSGLGVLPRGLSGMGGVRAALALAESACRLLVRGTSLPELFLLVYEGRWEGRLSES
jgi:hypothetical protein